MIGVAEVGQVPALAVPVVGLPLDRQRLLIAVDGRLKPPQLPVGVLEDVQGAALGVPVVGLPEIASACWQQSTPCSPTPPQPPADIAEVVQGYGTDDTYDT